MGLFGKKEPEEVRLLDEPLECLACAHDMFWRRQAQLNTATASFFNLDWANKTAICVVCSKCGFIHWFMPD